MRRTPAILAATLLAIAALASGADAATRAPSRWPSPATLTVADARALEADGVVRFEITADRPSVLPAAVFYVTRDGSARAGRDYRGIHVGLAVIAPGQRSTTISVPLIDDDVVEADETFEVALSWPLNARLARSRATATIVDDDRVLTVLHINDHHSHLQPDVGALTFDGVRTDVRFGGFARVVAKIRELEAAAGPNVVKLHAGDAITGTLYYSLFKGRADAEVMNELCFDAFTLGNHEFDDSDAGLAQFLDWLAEGDCDTPVLAANVVPQVGTPLAPTSPSDYLQPYVVKQYDGFQVGYVGIDIAGKTRSSSSPLETTQFLPELETAQRAIDELAARGVHNIVLVTHYTYAGDVELASKLRGVDVIVGGDSHSLLGEELSAFGLSPSGPYPARVTGADGQRVCVVQAWQYSWAVGELAVTFGADGTVLGCDGQPHVLLADSFTGTGVDPERVREIVAVTPQLSIVTPDPAAQAIIDRYAAEVKVLERSVIGQVTQDLCFERIPNQGRSPIPGCRELTAERGGHVQQVVTEAFRQRSFAADIAIQNAGGVRADLRAGPLTIADAFTVLPFANTLVNLEMTGAEIKQLLEDAGAFVAANPGANSGAYPYAAGLRWDADLNQPTGFRFTNLEVRPKGSATWVPIDPAATYTVVTNSFVAGGGDGFATARTVRDSGRATDTFIDYAQGFIDYVQQDLGGVVARPPAEDFSTQSFVPLR